MKNMKIPKRKTIILNKYIGFLMFIQIGGNVFVYRSGAETMSLNYIKLSEFDTCAYFPIRKI